MIIGYNENALINPIDYSDCASFMEVAVNIFQEMKVEESIVYQSIYENASDIKQKMSDFLKSWLVKIITLINKIRSFIMEKISKLKKKPIDKKDDTSIIPKDIHFSIESYDYKKITVDVLEKFSLIEWKSDDGSSPLEFGDSNFMDFISNKIKEWTGKDRIYSCTSNQINQYITEKYCGSKKINITEKTDGYSKSDVQKYISANEFDRFFVNLEKRAKQLRVSMRDSLEFFESHGLKPNASEEDIKEHKRAVAKMYTTTIKYMNLNSTLIAGLGSCVTDKALLFFKLQNFYN